MYSRGANTCYSRPLIQCTASRIPAHHSRLPHAAPDCLGTSSDLRPKSEQTSHTSYLWTILNMTFNCDFETLQHHSYCRCYQGASRCYTHSLSLSSALPYSLQSMAVPLFASPRVSRRLWSPQVILGVMEMNFI